MDRDGTAELVAQVREATAKRSPLRIRGGDTKRFYGRATDGTPLVTLGHAGVLRHDPAELVVTARGGTPVAELEAQLATRGQRLPFEHRTSRQARPSVVRSPAVSPARRAPGHARCATSSSARASWDLQG